MWTAYATGGGRASPARRGSDRGISGRDLLREEFWSAISGQSRVPPDLPRSAIIQRTMDFDQLVTFLEVAKLGSFSRAGQKVFRSQSAVSAQIRQLEQAY